MEVERSPQRIAVKNEASYRPVRAVGLLLVLQAAGLAAIGAYEFWQVISRMDWQRMPLQTPPPGVIEAAVFAFFVPSAVLMLVSAAGFLLLRRRGWVLAALSQGLSLAVCLWLYGLFGPYYVYPIMAYCVLMILYLNSHDVRAFFHVQVGRDQRGSHEPANPGDAA